MTTLTIKGVPEALYLRLKRRAVQNRRSLNGEILFCLEQAASLFDFDPHAWLMEVDRVRERLALTPLTASRLRQARTAGRP